MAHTIERAKSGSMAPKGGKLRHYPSFNEKSSFSPYNKVIDIEVDMAESLIASYEDVRPRQFRNRFEEYIFVFTVMLAQSSTTFLQGVVVINTASIGKSLNMTSSQITWISAAIALASGSLMIFFGKTADIFGRKIQLLTGMGVLSIFSLATAFAPSGFSLNILCGFLGLGTAVIAPPSIGTLFATYPEGLRRNRVLGWLGVGNPLGFILGSFSSGVTSKFWNWRASFIAISIFFFILAGLSVWTMPSITRSSNSPRQFQRFDWPGALLTIIGMALLTAALTEGPDLGWKNFKVILMLVLGVSCLAGFGFWENYFKNPLIDPTVWKNKNFTLCILIVFFGYMSFITNQFWICLYMQDVQHFSPLLIATRLLPQALIGVLWSYIGQSLVSRISGTWVMTIGAVCYILGAILCYFIRENSSYWTFLFFELLITVVGADFQFIVSNLYISQQMPNQSSLAAGILQTAMRLSIAVGLGITSAVFWSALNTQRGKVDATYPYERAFLCSIGFTIVGLLFVPFLNINTQGKNMLQTSVANVPEVEERPQSGAPSYDPQASPTYLNSDFHYIIRHKSSEASIRSVATVGSIDSYFPRWSWETRWPDDRIKYNSGASPFRYEVCIRCLEERRVIVPDGPNGNFNPYLGPHGWITQPYNVSELPDTRYHSKFRGNLDLIDPRVGEWPRSSYSEEFHKLQAHKALHEYQDTNVHGEDQNHGLSSQNQVDISLKCNSGSNELEKTMPSRNSQSENNSGTTYYSLDGPEAVKSAADLRKHHARKSQQKSSGTKSLECDAKVDNSMPFNYDGPRGILRSQVREGRNLLGHRRGRHAFDNHVKDHSLGGDTLHEIGVDYSACNSPRDSQTDFNTRDIIKGKGRFPIRVDKEIQFASPSSFDDSKRILSASAILRNRPQVVGHQSLASGQLENHGTQLPTKRRETVEVKKTYHVTEHSQISVPGFSSRDDPHRRDDSGHSHPSNRTLYEPRGEQTETASKRESNSNSYRSQGSIIEIRLGSEVRRSGGSNHSKFSFAPSIEVPSKSPLRTTCSDHSRTSIRDSRLAVEARQSFSSHSQATLDPPPRSPLREKTFNEVEDNKIEFKSTEIDRNEPSYILTNSSPEIPPRCSSLLINIPLDENRTSISTPRSGSQTSKHSKAATIEVKRSSDTNRSRRPSPSRLYYDGVKEEKLENGNWV